MASNQVTVRWGILATGWMATTFSKDLLVDPAVRGVHDVKHVITAVASSSSVSRASAFLKDIKAPEGIKAYGSYAELVADPNIDVVYVATPHSHHFQNAMLCLNAGKNVLCEKAFTVNAAQARKLVHTAKEKNLFLMEAVWTRYFPLSVKIRELVKSGAIGKVHRVVADLSMNFANDDGTLAFKPEERLVNMNLAGGALLDIGIYALTWVFQILYHCQEGPAREAPSVLSTIQKYKITGADESTAMILNWPGQDSMGIATTSLRVSSTPDGDNSPAAGPACRIQGTKGEIQVMGLLYRPEEYRVIKQGGPRGEVKIVDCPIPKDPQWKGPDARGWGYGYFWEADEVARCLRDGKKQSDGMTWEESLAIMDTMDEVRKQGGLVYPELIESDVFDAESSFNGKK